MPPPTPAGLAISPFSLARFVADLQAGFPADSIGEEPVMVGGLVHVTLSSLLAASPSYDVFLTARWIQDFRTALYATSAVGRVAPTKRQVGESSYPGSPSQLGPK